MTEPIYPAVGELVGVFEWRPYGPPREDEKQACGWRACSFNALPWMPRAQLLVEIADTERSER